jgi:hypothetical protein
MIKKWINFNESVNNVVCDGIDFGIERYMLDNILIDIYDEFPGIYMDLMSISSFKTYFSECSSGDINIDEFESELDKGGPKFVIVLDKPSSETDIWSSKEPVYFLEPKIWDILDNIDGLLSQYNLRIWGRDFFYADCEYYIIIEKI